MGRGGGPIAAEVLRERCGLVSGFAVFETGLDVLLDDAEGRGVLTSGGAMTAGEVLFCLAGASLAC